MRTPLFWSLVLLCTVAMTAVDAYKSVRLQRPASEAEREERHLFNQRKPPARDGDAEHMAAKKAAHTTRDPFLGSTLHHHRFGPRYGFDKKVQHDRLPKRYDGRGYEIPQDIPNHIDPKQFPQRRAI